MNNDDEFREYISSLKMDGIIDDEVFQHILKLYNDAMVELEREIWYDIDG